MSFAASLIPIARSVLLVPTTSITFANIPGAYSHLFLEVTGRGDAAAVTSTPIELQFNGDSTASYTYAEFYNTTSAALITEVVVATTFIALGVFPASTAAASRAVSLGVWIPFYSSATFSKNIVGTSFDSWDDVNGIQIRSIGGAYTAHTGAITALTLFLASGNMVAGSAVTLYGQV